MVVAEMARASTLGDRAVGRSKKSKAAVAATEVTAGPAAGGFDRKAYQRAYMRDVRAAKKAGLSVEAYRAGKAGE